MFPISRDPPEGGTCCILWGSRKTGGWFPISRDPPEGGTGSNAPMAAVGGVSNF